MVDIKNIIIIGKVGSGKSALANVLSGTEVFKEADSSVAEIWRAKDKEFEVKEEGREETIKYRVIDTIGLGNVNLTEKELSEKFEEEIGTYIDEGISQIFFVIGKKLDKEVLTEFFWLNEYLFDKKALDYTTIVRNMFNNFEEEECKKDAKELANNLTHFFDEIGKDKQTSEEINKGFIKKEVIYIDNPPITEPDEEDDKDDLRKRELNEEQRKKSRKILLTYLNNSKIEEHYKPETIKWLDKNYPFENEREKITVLDISKRNLKGRLNLKGFTNLKRLNCSNNQLTSLDLNDCLNLIELKCDNNQLTNLNFLKLVVNLEKLEIQNNQNLSPSSLKSLESLNKLEELNINNTNLSEGWKCLLKNCRKLYCDSKEIVEELDKKDDYYDLNKWRETDKQNSLTASVIPSERLFVIRSNLKKYVDKWGVKEEDDNNQTTDSKLKKYASYLALPVTWPYQQISKRLTKNNNENLSELSKLKNPTDASWRWWTNTSIQWTNRATLVAGGSLVLVGQSDTADPNSQTYTQTGGVIAIAGPFVETLTSYINDQILAVRQAQWEDFVADTKNMLDNYHELLGILEKIEQKNLGKINETLNGLRKTTKMFLNEYDKEDKVKHIRKNGVIDICELTEDKARAKLAKDLDKEEKWPGASQLGRIIKMMKKLEEEIIDYRQESSSVVHKQDKETLLNNQKQNLVWVIVDLLIENSRLEFNLETEYNQKGKNNWNGKSTWNSYLKYEITNEKNLAEKKVNLLLPLLEIVAEQLGKTDITTLLKDKEHEQKIAEFLKKTEDFYNTCQELKGIIPKETLTSLKKQVKELQKLEKISVDTKHAVAIDVEKVVNEEKKGLDKIIEKINSLDENLKNLHAKLTNDKDKEKDELQAHIEQMPYGVASGSKKN